MTNGSIYLLQLADRVAEKLELHDEDDKSETTNFHRGTHNSMVYIAERLTKIRSDVLKVHRTRDFIKFLKGKRLDAIMPQQI